MPPKFDGKALASQVLEAVKDYVGRATKGLMERLDALESKQAVVPERGERGEKGDPGERGLPGAAGEVGAAGRDGIDGKDGAPGERGEKGERGDKGEQGEKGVRGEVGPAGRDGVDGAPGAVGAKGDVGERGERGEPGRDGVDGKSAYQIAVEKGFSGDEAQWLESLRGKAGEAGLAGRDGIDGKSVTPDDVLPTVREWFDALPKPRDGKDGSDGKSITVEDIRQLFEAEQAKWALDFERRAMDLLQRCVERLPAPKDGKDGKDGRDALSLEDFDLVQSEDGRTITLSLARDGTRVEKSFVLSHPLYQGVWKSGNYRKGDSVTYGGSQWIAVRDTNAKPETDDDDSWKLSVKRGRDGKDGAKGERGERGLPGRSAQLGFAPDGARP